MLQHFQALRVLCLDFNNFGPLGARVLAPVLTSPNLVLQSLSIRLCNLGNDGVLNLIPDGEVNRSLTVLDLWSIDSRNRVCVENVLALASRCTNLDHLDDVELSMDQYHRMKLLLDRKRLYTKAQSLGGSPPAVMFQKLLQANSHEYGLSASFVILRDYFFAEQHKPSVYAVQAAATME